MPVLARWANARLFPFGMSLPSGVYGATAEVLYGLVEVSACMQHSIPFEPGTARPSVSDMRGFPRHVRAGRAGIPTDGGAVVFLHGVRIPQHGHRASRRKGGLRTALRQGAP